MATFQEGSEVTSAEDDPDSKAAWKISQACYNHGLFHEHSLYTRKRLVSYPIILVFQH